MINIRIIREEDAQDMHTLVQRNARRLEDYFPVTIEKTVTAEKTLQTIKMYKMLEEQKQLVVFMVEQKSDKKLVAIVFLKNFDKKVNKCEVSCFVDEETAGKGICSQAIKEIAAMAFKNYGVDKLFCRIDTKNDAANKLAVKSGFQLEGVLRQEFRIADNSIVDINYYGMLQNPV